MVWNDILVGTVDFTDSTDRSCLAYLENLSASIFDMDYTIAFGTKGDCPASTVSAIATRCCSTKRSSTASRRSESDR